MKFSNLYPLIVALPFALTPACSSGGGGGAPAPATVDVSGEWSIAETITSANGDVAGELGRFDSYRIDVIQNGNDISVRTPVGSFRGTLSGNRLQWTGSYPEDGGTTTITRMDLVVTGNSLSGDTSWNWSDGFFSGSGTTSVSGQKISSNSNAGFGIFNVVLNADEKPGDLVVVVEGDDEQDLPTVYLIDEEGVLAHVKPGRYDIRLARKMIDADGAISAGEAIRSFYDVEIVAGQERMLIDDEHDLPMDEGGRDRTGGDGAVSSEDVDAPTGSEQVLPGDDYDLPGDESDLGDDESDLPIDEGGRDRTGSDAAMDEGEATRNSNNTNTADDRKSMLSDDEHDLPVDEIRRHSKASDRN